MRITRFPRKGRPNSEGVSYLCSKAPLPAYDSSRDGQDRDAPWKVVFWILSRSSRKLRKLCDKHALSSEGSKDELRMRMYLHWRARRLRIGSPKWGYGKGFESVREPDCPCGIWADVDFEKKERREVMTKKTKVKCHPRPLRYPRLVPLRYPRLKQSRQR